MLLYFFLIYFLHCDILRIIRRMLHNYFMKLIGQVKHKLILLLYNFFIDSNYVAMNKMPCIKNSRALYAKLNFQIIILSMLK